LRALKKKSGGSKRKNREGRTLLKNGPVKVENTERKREKKREA